MNLRKCLVLLSGGQDSATCLAYAKENIAEEVWTLAFYYGQRHQRELEMSAKLSKLAGAKGHFALSIPTFKSLSDSALLGAGDIGGKHRGNESLPASFVPGRNFIFLGFAAAKAYQLGINQLVTGVCQTDYSGYPDCRHLSIKAVETALNACLDYPLVVHTPLMWKTKAETVKLMEELGHLDWYKYTHTCYEGVRPPCGECPACELRAKGFQEAGVEDPLLEVSE